LRQLTWFFDLDNTLHDASWRVFDTLDHSINAYLVRHLGIEIEAADRLRVSYWRRYGATLLGLVLHHAVEPRHFLSETHGFIDEMGAADLIRSERGLARLLARLPGRKVLITNAPARYAKFVLRRIGAHRHIASGYAIERMVIHGRLRPKPSRAMLRVLLVKERVAPHRAVLVEDSAANLKSARSLGLHTVLIRGHDRTGDNVRKSRPPYVDLQVKSISQLVSRQSLIRSSCPQTSHPPTFP